MKKISRRQALAGIGRPMRKHLTCREFEDEHQR
jgi:hypothetical protein